MTVVPQTVVVVSIDAVAPRFVTPATMPNLVALGRSGAAELAQAAGELIVFDNRRVLHARTAFDASSARHLQGCYIDIDALRSRARIARAAAVTESGTGSRCRPRRFTPNPVR